MLSRFSVKRPYVIFVAVVIVLLLGAVAGTRMKTDLLPQMDMPYLAVITTDPGASAEKVEQEVTNPMEGALSTISGVSAVTSISRDNYSLLFLQFEDGTNMDGALVKVSSAANSVTAQLPDGVGAPTFMEISMDMMATMYVTASYDGKDIYELSDFVENTLVEAMERVDGVADVSPSGLVEQSVEVRLSDSKIEDINNKLLAEVNSQLYDAKKQIDEGKAALADAKDQVQRQQGQLSDQEKQTETQLGTTLADLNTQMATLQAQKTSIEAAITTKTMMDQDTTAEQAALQQVNAGIEQLQAGMAQAEAGGLAAAAGFGSGNAQLASALSSIESSEKELESAQEQYEESREAALSQANIDKLMDKGTLSQLIAAQNFSMPAGYIKDESGNQWLVRVGDDLEGVDALRNLELVDLEGVGPVRLSDVADITVISNEGKSYMRVNGADGVLVSVFKASTASTSEVSDLMNAQLKKLEDRYSGLHLDVVTDQGSYIGIYINTIARSLLLGALLAIIVLAIFLLDWKPTVIVAFSIPFSVLCAFILMYFTGIGINIMSLGGISLAVGMLVDNSIIVLENIYRLRGRGISAARAAVQGAKQIAGAAVASTLTTVAVFLPIVFTTGLVNQLMLPFALSIAYVLCASLVVALTLVPAISSFVFKNYVPRENKLFAHVQNGYAKTLGWALRLKIVPIGLSVLLLVGAVYGVVNMGVTLIPSMTGKSIEVSVTMPEGTQRDTAFAVADKIMDAAMTIDGVQTVGAMDGTSSVSVLSSDLGSNNDELVGMFSFYLQTDDSVSTEARIYEIQDELKQKTADLDCEIMTASDSSDSMSSMLGSGLSVTISGPDQEKLADLSKEVMAAVGKVEGYTEIDDGTEDATKELHLVVDKDKVAAQGYTVAQLFADLAGKITTEANATNMKVDAYDMDVTIVDETNEVTRENLLDTEIEITNAQGETSKHKLSEFARAEETTSSDTIFHTNGNRVMTVTAKVEDGYNNALLYRELSPLLDKIDCPDGYSIGTSGELDNVNTMLEQMLLLLVLGFILIYLIMVAQFQSLLSPLIVIFTVPLAFTGGLFALVLTGEHLTMLSLMGFAVLMGTIVNNGIVFVDYVNQLRVGGLEKREALIATGRTRMRPILMTALTTILAMMPMVLSQAVGSSMERGMAIVVVGGLLYATLMTLYVVPCMYDILYRKKPHYVDLGDESIEEDAGDAEEYLRSIGKIPAHARR